MNWLNGGGAKSIALGPIVVLAAEVVSLRAKLSLSRFKELDEDGVISLQEVMTIKIIVNNDTVILSIAIMRLLRLVLKSKLFKTKIC